MDSNPPDSGVVMWLLRYHLHSALNSDVIVHDIMFISVALPMLHFIFPTIFGLSELL